MKAIRNIFFIIILILLCAFAVGMFTFRSFDELKKWADDIIFKKNSEIILSSDENYNVEMLLAYSQLNDEEKMLYSKMLNAFYNYEESIYIDTNTQADISKIFHAVSQDNPDIFWVESVYSSSSELLSQTVFKKLTFNYTYTREEGEELYNYIDNLTDDITANLPADDYSKALYLHDYIVGNTDYVEGSPEDQNIVSVFVYGQSVCGGYAKALQYLYIKAGIPCTYVTGDIIKSGQRHAWNIANIDGEWYQIDVTWDDPVYNETSAMSSVRTYSYFLITSREMYITHSPDNEYPYVPEECVSKANNYYVRNSAYFDNYSYNDIYAVVREAVRNSDNAVSIKFSDYELYDSAVKKLINEYEMHYMVNTAFGLEAYSNRSLMYLRDDELFILTVSWQQ